MELAEQARNEAPEDYRGDDGLLYCGRCFTAKEFNLDDPNLPRIKNAPTPCKCQKEAENREKEAKSIARVERIARTHWSENAKWFSQDNGHLPKVSDVCRRYVEQWQEMCQSGTGILFYGDVERGKTFMATCIASELLKRGVPTYVTTVSRIISQMGGAFEGEDFLHEVCKWSLLVIDDVGTDWGSAFTTSRTFDAINARVACGKPTIFTTNLSLDDMTNEADIAKRRIYSRILGACPIKLMLDGTPQRQQVAERKRQSAIRSLFRRKGTT